MKGALAKCCVLGLGRVKAVAAFGDVIVRLLASVV